MHTFFLYSSVVLTIIIAVPLVRVLNGPTLYDRILATNAITTKTIVLIALIGYLFDSIACLSTSRWHMPFLDLSDL